MTGAKPRPPLIPGETRTYPVLPLRDTVVFPHMIAPLFVGRKKSILAKAVASSRVEKLQPKEPQTWKTTRRVGKSFANGWRFRRTSDRRQIRPRPSPKGPSSRTSFSAVAASRTTESWDGCCRASAGRDRSSRPIRLERFSPLARSVDFERYDFRVGGLSGRTAEIVSMERYRRHRTRSHCNRARVVAAQRCDELAARFFRDIMRVADARENKMALVPSKFRDSNPSGAKMLARVRVVIGVSRLG